MGISGEMFRESSKKVPVKVPESKLVKHILCVYLLIFHLSNLPPFSISVACAECLHSSCVSRADVHIKRP